MSDADRSATEPLAAGQVRENPHNGHRCIVRSVVDESHADVHWFGWPHSDGVQDVGWTRVVLDHERQRD